MNFEKITPQAAGISEKSLNNFFARLDELPIDMHSVIMIRYGKLILESYYEPYTKNMLHRMFSVTKSFVGLAIGCLIDDGKINLDAPITSYFPEYPTDYEYIRHTTIRDMLMMRTAHEKTTYKSDLSSDWVKSFFTVKPSHMSGTVFSYDTSSTHVLDALVEKITEMPFLDYLRLKFLDELGFSKDAYCLTDPNGVSMGGSGLMARPMDLAIVAYLVLSGGKYNSKQLISHEFLSAATSCLSRTDTRGGFADEKQGYGMQFWRTRHNGFMFYGIGGQLALCLPDKDFIFVTTADTLGCQGGVQAILDAFWHEIYEKLDTNVSEKCSEKVIQKIKPIIGNLKIFFGEYEFSENKLGLSRLRVSTDENGGSLVYENKTGTHTLEFAQNNFYRGKFPFYNCDCITSGAWLDNTLIVKSRLIGEMLGSVTLELFFTDYGVTLSARKTEETYFNEFSGIVQGKRI
jgi:CubicO group peptidase (beta-lactamase class C family)